MFKPLGVVNTSAHVRAATTLPEMQKPQPSALENVLVPVD
jgi:hypothetical protein